MSTKNKQLAFAIVDFLQSAGKAGTDDQRESLEVATQCIQEVFDIDINDEAQQKEFHFKPGTLQSIFDVYLKTQQKMAKAAKPEITPENIKKAEELKTQGNKKVGEKKFDEAITLYNQAIELNPDNAVFYSNRAAAYSQTGRHDLAIKDAKHSLELDPTYSKAHSRLGFAHYSIGDYPEAVACYTKALEYDPDNDTIKATLAQAKARLDAAAPVVEEPDDVPAQGSSARGAGSAPAGGMPDLSSLLNNPALMNMAQQMMGNPQFAQMAQGLMGGAGGAGAGAGGPAGLAGLMNNPNVANMARQAMQDPNIMNMLGNLSGAGGDGGSKKPKK